jgi:hypothetical protein
MYGRSWVKLGINYLPANHLKFILMIGTIKDDKSSISDFIHRQDLPKDTNFSGICSIDLIHPYMPDKYITLSTSKMKLGLTFWSPILHINIT